MYVYTLLLSSVNLYGIRLCERGTQWDLNSFVFEVFIYVLWRKEQAGNINACKNEINKYILKKYKSLRKPIHFYIYIYVYTSVFMVVCVYFKWIRVISAEKWIRCTKFKFQSRLSVFISPTAPLSQSDAVRQRNGGKEKETMSTQKFRYS